MPRLIHKADMRITQVLASGTIIRQDFRTSARFVFFDTGNEHWQYATHGGTLFVVLYKARPYGLTCRHVLGSFKWQQLVVTDERHGTQVAGIRSVAHASHPRGEVVGTDLLDVVVIVFDDDVGAAFFSDPPYILDKKTIATSRVGDVLHVAGALKAKSEIDETTIAPSYCLLELRDHPSASSDPTLRCAIGKFDRPGFSDVVGLSGSPVFNVGREHCAVW